MVVIPVDWRSHIAALPRAKWSASRRRVLEILEALGHKPSADEIRAADRAAADEIMATVTTSQPDRASVGG